MLWSNECKVQGKMGSNPISPHFEEKDTKWRISGDTWCDTATTPWTIALRGACILLADIIGRGVVRINQSLALPSLYKLEPAEVLLQTKRPWILLDGVASE